MSVDASAVARVIGITTEFKNLRAGAVLFLPRRIAVFAQGASASVYSTTKFQITSAPQAGSKYGYGSPIHLIARELFPQNGDGVGTIAVTVYPLEDGYDAVAAAGSITPSGTATKAHTARVRVNGILSETFVVDEGAIVVATLVDRIVAAVNSVLEMPVIAEDGTTVANFDMKWAGPSGNDGVIEVITESLGVTYAIVQPTGGLVNPDITAALAQVGNVWETDFLNALNIADEDILDEFQTFGEGRWGTLVHKPCIVYTGNTEADVTTAITLPDSRKDDRINSQLVAPGSVNFPFVVAARQLARITKVANDNPPVDYVGQKATGLLPGTDGEQWDYPMRDQAVKAGSSTVEVVDSVVTIANIVTFYHPTGEPEPAYRFNVDISKLQTIIYNIALIFAAPEWAGAPLVPDNQVVVNPRARKPSAAKAAVGTMLEELGKQALISDPETAKKNTTAVINSQNSKRLDVVIPVQLSGNSNIIDAKLEFSFFLGLAEAA